MTKRENPDHFAENARCETCHKNLVEISMQGYAEYTSDISLCIGCATQLARKLLEDLCVYACGGRHV